MSRMRMVAACAALAAAVAAEASYTVEDAAGQSAVWADLGSRGQVATRDPRKGDSYWVGGSAPDITNPTATNLVIDLSATATEAKRLAEIAAGVTTQYYGPTKFCVVLDDNSNNGLYLNTLTGNVWSAWIGRWSSSTYPIMLRDASAFKGYFDISDTERGNHEQLYLYPGAGETGTINRVVANGGWGVKVPKGAYGIVNEVIGAGTLEVNQIATTVGKFFKCPFPSTTEGTVEIMNQPGPLTTLKILNGDAVLHGHEATEPTGLAGEPALHLDASATQSLTLAGDNVSVWRDADGRTDYYASRSDTTKYPRLTTDAVSGQVAVDFGGIAGASANGVALTNLFGPAGMLTLNANLPNVQEIAVVFRDHYQDNLAAEKPQLVGNGLTEWSRDWYRSSNMLLHGNNFCDAPVWFGSTVLNGQTTLPAAVPNTSVRMNVLSSSLSDGHRATLRQIGGAGTSSKWYGGALISEIVIYTNVLTKAERMRTHRYLMHKWCADDRMWDWERIEIQKGNAITVADGVLSVRELNLPSTVTTLVKKGAGTLEIGSYPPTLRRVEIEEGEVVFVQGYAKNDNPQPAANAALHFDATQSARDMTTYEADGKTMISEWRSYPLTNASSHAYTLKRSSLPSGYSGANDASLRLDYPRAGLAMVDCGKYRAYADGTKNITNDAAGLSFSLDGTQEGDDRRHREGFAVYVKTDSRATALSSRGWAITKMSSDHKDVLLHDSYAFNRVVAGYWTYDGSWCEPWKQTDACDAVHVVGFRATACESVNGFFMDRGGTYGPDGGGLLGEVIYYDRTLTPQERRDTELYLLRKWKDPNAVHPRDAWLPSSLPILAYADKRQQAQVRVESGVVTQSLASATRDLDKTGSGTMVLSLDAEPLRNVRVSGGTLTIADDVLKLASYHADATDLSSMTYTVANGVTNVTVWDGGKALTSWNSKPTRLPQLVSADLNGLGYTMPLVDFGVFATNVASLVAQSSTLNWPSLGALQEFYVVEQDKTADVEARDHPQLIGTTGEGVELNPNCSYPFHRQVGCRDLMMGWCDSAFVQGYVSMDGVKTTVTKTLTDTNLHAYAFVPSVAITNTFAFARRINYKMGGVAVGECIAFGSTNTVRRRQQIETYLCNKWLGRQKEMPSLWNLESVTLEDGATLNLSNGGSFAVPSLSGSGTIAFGGEGGALTNTTALAFAFAGATEYDHVAVSGTFDVAESGSATVTFAVPEGVRRSSLTGDYTLLSADTFTHIDRFANWTFSIVDVPRNVVANVRFEPGRGLVLSVQPAGAYIIVR